jgi:hypothetical protein
MLTTLVERAALAQVKVLITGGDRRLAANLQEHLSQARGLMKTWKLARPTALTRMPPATFRGAVQAVLRSHTGWTDGFEYQCPFCEKTSPVADGNAHDHPLSCPKQGKSHLHTLMGFVCEEMVRKAGQTVDHEPPLARFGVPWTSADPKKQAVKADWAAHVQGRLTAFDLSIPHARWGQKPAARVAGVESAKVAKYAHATPHLTFEPVVCSLLGLKGKSFKAFLKLVEDQTVANGRTFQGKFYGERLAHALASDIGRRWAEGVFGKAKSGGERQRSSLSVAAGGWDKRARGRGRSSTLACRTR